jgi:hypothetical protein
VRLTVPQLLLGLVAALVAVDCVWALLGHFSLDLMGYLKLALMSAGLFAGAAFYSTLRPEPRLAAMLFGAGFLCAFSASASVLNYFLITVAGSPIDSILIKADHLLGFDWYDVLVGMASYPLLNEALFRIYNMVLPQMAVLIVVLGCMGHSERIYRYCLAVAAGALIAIAIWAAMPSLGAKAFYSLPAWVEARLTLSVTPQYGRELMALLNNGPGYITPADLRGLIAFPSYHGVLAILLIWFARPVRWLFWPYLIVNAIVLISTPIQGGHHLVDVLAAFPVALLSLALAGEFRAISLKPSALVNKVRNFADRPVPQGQSPRRAAQLYANTASIIKSKLSRAA